MASKSKGLSFDIAVIGAGASGLMAAITAARNGKSVVVLEHKDKAGKKLLATGNGRCNFTNEKMNEECFRGDKELLKSILSQFTKDNCLDFFKEIGILPKAKNGYYYPNSMQAASVLDALLTEALSLGVEFIYSCNIKNCYREKYAYIIESDSRVKANKIIIAVGLLANPKLGSDGSFFDIIKSFGHRFTKIYPSLCGFEANGFDFKAVSGVRCEASLSLKIDNALAYQEQGELQLADYGLSGIPVFQLSSLAVQAIHNKKNVSVAINFMPDFSCDSLTDFLLHRRNSIHDDRNIADFLNGLLNNKLVSAIIQYCKFNIKDKAIALSDYDIRLLSNAITNLEVSLVKERSYDFAQVCTGGIRSEEISINSLESNYEPGLFFAGEILDVDGICGGYNLQWAWSSGYVAGINAST